MKAKERIQQSKNLWIEEFIEGREIDAIVVENVDSPNDPLVINPVELLFEPGESFMHKEMKKSIGKSIKVKNLEEPELLEKINKICKASFKSCMGVGYASVVCRIDSKGNVYVVDINANPKIFHEKGEFEPIDFCFMSKGI